MDMLPTPQASSIFLFGKITVAGWDEKIQDRVKFGLRRDWDRVSLDPVPSWVYYFFNFLHTSQIFSLPPRVPSLPPRQTELTQFTLPFTPFNYSSIQALIPPSPQHHGRPPFFFFLCLLFLSLLPSLSAQKFASSSSLTPTLFSIPIMLSLSRKHFSSGKGLVSEVAGSP